MTRALVYISQLIFAFVLCNREICPIVILPPRTYCGKGPFLSSTLQLSLSFFPPLQNGRWMKSKKSEIQLDWNDAKCLAEAVSAGYVTCTSLMTHATVSWRQGRQFIWCQGTIHPRQMSWNYGRRIFPILALSVPLVWNEEDDVCSTYRLIS